MKTCKVLLALVLSMVAFASWAQMGPPGGVGGDFGGGPQERAGARGQGPGGFMDGFFPPELIMQNQQALGLNDEQKSSVREIMKKSMAEFTDLQWQQSAEQEAMGSLLKGEKIDEAKALAQFDKLVSIENQIKKLHITTMIKVKNILSPDQQKKLRSLTRQKIPGLRGGAPGAMGQQGLRRMQEDGGGQDAPQPPVPPER